LRETGIEGDPVPKGFFAQLWFPFSAILRNRMRSKTTLETAGQGMDNRGV
jgi:hypothetical protein